MRILSYICAETTTRNFLYQNVSNRQKLYFVRAKATRSEDRLRFNFKAEFVADSRSMKKTFRNKQVFSTWNIIKNVASYCLDINAILTFCIICKN